VIGVMVGNKASNPTYVGYLQDVVGALEWNGSVAGDGSVDVGNAVTADFFTGSFDQLGGVLRSIMIAECGGTLTLQKRIDTGPSGSPSLSTPTEGVWSYSTENGVRELDRAITSSITFDYIFDSGGPTKSVQVTEQPVPGYVWDRAECTSDGTSVPSIVNSDGSFGVTVTVSADQAVSCLMISRPA
jgi:hypothetical protein